jgi:hypothetical protein
MDTNPAPLTASESLAKALGRPVPPPLTGERLRAWWAAQKEVDAELERRYGSRALRSDT